MRPIVALTMSCWLASAPAGAAVTYSFADFSAFTIVDASPNGSASLVAGAYLDATITLGSLPQRTFAYGIAYDAANRLDPASFGPIGTIDMSVESFGCGLLGTFNSCGGSIQGFGLALEQGGQFFFHGFSAFTVDFPFWNTRSAAGLTAGSFTAVSGGVSLSGVHPDFSASGAPIAFGLYMGNTDGPSGQITETAYDNLQVTAFSPVPEPSGLALLATAGLTFAWRRRKG